MTEIDQLRMEVRGLKDRLPEYDSVKDYAKRMSISERTIRRYISEGKIEVKEREISLLKSDKQKSI